MQVRLMLCERSAALPVYITARDAAPMLLLGTCNPSGERAQYNGLYYTADELAALVRSNALRGVPVKTEHTGNEIGRVVSGFLDAGGALQCVMELDESTLEGAIAEIGRASCRERV